MLLVRIVSIKNMISDKKRIPSKAVRILLFAGFFFLVLVGSDLLFEGRFEKEDIVSTLVFSLIFGLAIVFGIPYLNRSKKDPGAN
jgi:hypothetical protein